MRCQTIAHSARGQQLAWEAAPLDISNTCLHFAFRMGNANIPNPFTALNMARGFQESLDRFETVHGSAAPLAANAHPPPGGSGSLRRSPPPVECFPINCLRLAQG